MCHVNEAAPLTTQTFPLKVSPKWTKVDLMDQVDRTRLKCYALDFKYYIDVLIYNNLILITSPFSPLL